MCFTCCQTVDSSLKKIIFTYCSQEQTLSRLHYLLPNIYSSMKKILKNCWRKAPSSKFWRLGSPTCTIKKCWVCDRYNRRWRRHSNF